MKLFIGQRAFGVTWYLYHEYADGTVWWLAEFNAPDCVREFCGIMPEDGNRYEIAPLVHGSDGVQLAAAEDQATAEDIMGGD